MVYLLSLLLKSKAQHCGVGFLVLHDLPGHSPVPGALLGQGGVGPDEPLWPLPTHPVIL